jgi:hypothetical protein
VFGRRTGRPYTFPVQNVRQADLLWIISGAGPEKTWWRNLVGGAPVAILAESACRASLDRGADRSGLTGAGGARSGENARGKRQIAEEGGMSMGQNQYPVQFSVDYPDRDLNRLTTLFRLFTAIPILIVLGAVSGAAWTYEYYDRARDVIVATSVGAGGLLVFGPLLMILFRQKYPRWWFDWNLNLFRFSNRVGAYLALMDDRYPSTDEEQYIHLDIPYPDAGQDLNRWLPLVKWFLAIPHYIVLFFLWIGAVVAVIIAWFAILFTGRYPRGLFGYVEGVIRWGNRVTAYAFLLATDRYPPFQLRP